VIVQLLGGYVSEQSPRTNKAATAQNSESIQIAASEQQQRPTAPNSASTGNAPVAAGAEASTTPSQSIPATPDQPKKPSQSGLTIEGLTSIKLGDGELLYAETWLPDAEQWFELLKTEVPWSPETVKMYGKPLVLRRETCNYGEDYDYNVNAKPAIEWDGPVLELKKMLEDATGRVFTQCACNLYPDGETGIGLHHDKRHPLLVASISFGAVRTMGFAPKGGKLDKSLPMVPLASGSLLLFADVINENFKHTIVEDKSVHGPRISVTFREFATKADGAPKLRGKVTRQMSPNLPVSVAAAQIFQSVPDFVAAYDHKKKTIDDLTGKFVDKANEAKQAQDDILPHLADMQSLLSKKGTNHHLVIAARKQGHKIPWWTEYYESYKDKLWKSLRTMERRIAEYRNDPTAPAPGRTSDRDPVPHFNRAERKALIEGNHRAVEMVDALEAGRDAKHEITEFKAVMTAKRLDDIMQAHEQEPDYKGILMKVMQTVADMNATLPAAFVKSVRDLTKPCKFKITVIPDPTHKNNGNSGADTGNGALTRKRMQIAPIPHKPPEWSPLEPGKKYTVRPHPQGGSGVYEVGGSTVCWQKHPSQDEAWDAIEAVNSVSTSARQPSDTLLEVSHA
jgi:alkylated DNA repair dioxygenase AlkB